VAVDRGFTQSPFETAYGELLYLFDRDLRVGRREGDPHNGILVADRGKYERMLEAWVEVARARSRRPRQDERRLYALAEVPFFVDSKSTRLMQLADLVAHGVYRAYHAGDHRWIDALAPDFRSDSLSKLLHLTKDKGCGCLVCGPGSGSA
jgi:hypothetical protein